MNSEEIWYGNGDDISDRCIKCDSSDIVKTEIVELEWAPLWASYLASTGISFFYRRLVQKVALNIGYCKKHSPEPILAKIFAYSTLVLSGILIFLGQDLNIGYLTVTGIFLMFVFLALISRSTAIKAKKIIGSKVQLLKPIPQKNIS